jgi:adenylate cyclase class IV
MTTETLEHIEFETKYSIEDHLLIEFKQIVEALPETKAFIYVEGPDLYFTYPDWWFKNNQQWDAEGTFARYRKPSYGLDNGRRQVTWKYKPIDSKNNIQREELNWDLKNETDEKTVLRQLERSGASFNFSIIKNCHIYKMDDATVVFYTVYDTTDGKPKKADSFIEIEVCEEKIKNMTPDEAFAIIAKYEKILEPLGINARKRLKKSLFQMFVRRK